MKAALKRAIQATRRLAEEWVQRYFPRAPDPHGGGLIASTSITQLFDPPGVELRIGVEYLKYVMAMAEPGVHGTINWTNPETAPRFVDRLLELIQEWLRAEITKEFKAFGGAGGVTIA